MAKSSVEGRVAILEKEVADLKAKFNTLAPNGKPWWDRVVGSFAGDDAFQQAMELGRAYRRSQKSPRKGR